MHTIGSPRNNVMSSRITFRISKNTNYLHAYRYGAVFVSNEKRQKVRLEKRFGPPTCAIETIHFIANLHALKRTTYLSPFFGSRSHDKRSVPHNTEHTNKFIFCRISPFDINYPVLFSRFSGIKYSSDNRVTELNKI